jgi:hypothetical protein
LQINLGPVSPGMAGETKVATPFAYNPRCAKRDLTTYSSTNWLTYSNLYNITLGPASGNIELFQNELQGRFPEGLLGLHAAGHYAIGGDASDFYSSPNDLYASCYVGSCVVAVAGDLSYPGEDDSGYDYNDGQAAESECDDG